MKLNTLTEKQRIILCRALHFYAIGKERRKEEKEDIEYLQYQLKNGKGTE